MIRLPITFFSKSSVLNSISFRTMSLSNRINVTVEQGVVSGVRDNSEDGIKFCSFKGIPYAKTPERFKYPEKLAKFNVPVLDCSKHRNSCFQKNTFGAGFIGSEDCLFLNVYSPKMPEESDKKLPVMVFLHGGAYQWGQGDSDLYSPEYFVKEGVVLVTINYRLNALGFSCLPAVGINGNAGLKDQLMALKWVNENIANFNGDPNNITLFGESAGGASVHFHVLSPNSREYFHKAICQSGTAFGDWAFKKDIEDRTRLLGKLLGCKGNSDQEIYETLKNADLTELQFGMMKVITPDEKRRALPFTFKPTIEPDNPSAILRKTPIQLLKEQQDEIKMPIIFGSNNRDGMIMLLDAVKKLDAYDNDPVRFIPMSVNVNPMSPEAEKLGQEIKKFYFGDEPVCKDNISGLADLMTDFHFLISQTVSTELHTRYQKNSPTYVYEFGFDGELNMFKTLFQLDLPGACHADELFYLFVSKLLPVELEECSPAYKMRTTMCKLWTNFAKNSDPTPDDSLPFKWTSLDKQNPLDTDCLVINETCEMVKNPRKDRIEFWGKVYKQWNENLLNPKL